MSEETKPEEVNEEKKGFFTKLKEGIDDKEEQLDALSTMVRLGVLIWSGGILTLAYIQLPPAFGIPEQKLDPTFIASVFTGTLATFGVQASKKGGGGGASAAGGPTQTIRIEQAPIKLTVADLPPKPPTV